MTALWSARHRPSGADGGGTDVMVLTEAGLAELYRCGWDTLARRLDAAGCRFVGFRLETEPPGSDGHPLLVDRTQSAATVRWLLYTPPALSWFRGHFPGRPILPGVVQIHWAARLAEREGVSAAGFTGLSGVKFLAPVLPGDLLALSLEPGTGRVGFTFETPAGVRSRGTLHYRV